jgi:mersacidin/lichenicidin family type 2 lantibiotic
MNPLDIIRAWKDEDYRLNLSEEQRAQLPEHPSGLIELTFADLGGVAGGAIVLSQPDPDACDTLPRFCGNTGTSCLDTQYGCGPTVWCSSDWDCTLSACYRDY